MKNYDIVIIGSGPAGHKAAIAASKLGKRVAIVERNFRGMGGVCLHKGTIPSKTMREAILFLTGYRHRDVYTKQYRKKRRITMQDLRLKLASVAEHELDVIHDQLERNGVEIFIGEARFASPHEVEVDCETGRQDIVIRGIFWWRREPSRRVRRIFPLMAKRYSIPTKSSI